MSSDALATRSSPHFKRYLPGALPLNTTGADSISPAVAATETVVGRPGFPTRAIRAEGSGVVTVKRMDGTSVALPFFDGEMQDVQCTEITSTTTTAVIAYW